MDTFFQAFPKHILSTDTLILAVSGGVDSMILFDLVKKNHPKEKIIVAHFDHSLRGDESDGDREFVVDYATDAGIRCEVQKKDIQAIAQAEKSSLEAVARRERYAFLESVRIQHDARYILTAHHRDDQAETILMNLIKGGKVRGLSGMQTLSGNILRPLLTSSKQSIIAYATENHIEYREDSTNQDTDYTRNNIRHNIVPLLQDINPSIGETLSELGGYMQELTVFLREYTDTWLQQAENASGREKSFLISEFILLEEFMKREIISALYARAHDDSTQGLSRGMIAEIIRFITEGSNSYGIKDIKKLHLERRGDRVYY